MPALMPCWNQSRVSVMCRILRQSKRDGCDRRARLCRRMEIWRRFSNVADFSADFAFDVFALFDAGRSHSGKRRLQCGEILAQEQTPWKLEKFFLSWNPKKLSLILIPFYRSNRELEKFSVELKSAYSPSFAKSWPTPPPQLGEIFGGDRCRVHSFLHHFTFFGQKMFWRPFCSFRVSNLFVTEIVHKS